MSTQKWLAASLAVVALPLVAGWGGSAGKQASGKAKPEVSSITIGATPVSPYVPLYAANKLGYFKDEGLDVKIEIGVGGAQQLPLVIQGQMQLAVTPIVTAVQAREQGFDLALIRSPTYVAESGSPPGQTATLVRASGPVKALKDLEGKKIAVNAIGSLNWLYNRAMLDDAGVNVNTVTYVEVPFPNMLDALTNGSVDAIVEVQPFVSFADARGANVLAWDFLRAAPGVKLTAYAASRSWAASHPNTMAAVQRALNRAVDYLTSHPDETRTLTSEFTGTPPLPASAGLPKWSTTDLTAPEIQTVMKLMIKYKLLSKPFNPAFLLAPRPPAQLEVTVSSKGKVALRGAIGLGAGKGVVVVDDQSKTGNFRLTGPANFKKATGAAFTGKVTWDVNLRAGTYTYRSDSGGPRGSFTVKP